MNRSMLNISLFRVPTCEIMKELCHRSYYHERKSFKDFSSEELLSHVLKQRMESFENT